MAYSLVLTRNGIEGKYAGRWTPIWAADGATLDFNFQTDYGWIDIPENPLISTDTSTGRKGFTFVRESVANSFDETGRLVSFSSGIERPYFDPVTKQKLGILLESEATNQILYCRDFTNDVWKKANSVVSKDQNGIDGRQNSACSVKATRNNASVSQTISFTAGQRVSHVWIKRLSGSGRIFISQRGTSQLLEVAVDSGWKRFSTPSFSFSGTSSPFVIQIERSGDSIAVDFAQSESSSIPTSPIETFGVPVTRTSEQVVFSDIDSWLNSSQGTLVVEYRLLDEDIPFDGKFVSVSNVDEDNYIEVSSLATEGKIQAKFVSDTATTQFYITTGDFSLSGRAVVSWTSETVGDPDIPTNLSTMTLGTVLPDDGEFYWILSRVYYDPRITETDEFEGLN